MSASNHNWVCFDCRTSRRHPKESEKVPICRECEEECFCLGDKVEVTGHDAVRAWRKLRENCRNILHFHRDRSQRMRVRRKHEVEREIARLEGLDNHKDRARTILRLKEELQSYHRESFL